MKKILLISSIYPGPDVPSIYTPVVHYFAKEWVQMGYNVRVIHTSNYFPSIYYWVPTWLRYYIASKKGFALPEKRLNKEFTFLWENVSVYRVPMKKIMPGKGFHITTMNEACRKIVNYLNTEDFMPDYIIGHWVMPQAHLLYKLKNIYNCPITLVLHDDGHQFCYYREVNKILNSIDAWGFRSEKIRVLFEKKFGKRENKFICMSGIPSAYLEGIRKRNWIQSNRYIYVGMLIQRKHPDKLIKVLHDMYGDESYTANIIGSGGMDVELELLVQILGCEKNVNLLGRLERSKVMEYLDNSDIFVMISENEVFGLVYIEAMARGCIVVASRGEGMHGIIEDGVNGFFCKAGDVDELRKILVKINSMTALEKKRISENAMYTAAQHTDKKMAALYLNSVVSIGNK